MYKTHTCGELRLSHTGQPVTLAGWVHRRRDHGGVTFIDLRDRFGLIQVVFNPEISPEAHQAVVEVRSEWVIQVSGVVRPRPEGMQNPNLPTGEMEVEVHAIQVLNPAKTPPFLINKEEEVDEQTRLRYRYLDLRRERMPHNLILRHRVVKFIRDYLDRAGLYRGRDADPVQDHPRRRARLPGALARPSRAVLRPAAVAPAAQAAADGGRGRALLPDRALLPR